MGKAKYNHTNNYSSDLGLNKHRMDILLNRKGGLKTIKEVIAAIEKGFVVINTTLTDSAELKKAINEIGILDIRYHGDYTLYREIPENECIHSDEIYENSDVNKLFERLGPQMTIDVETDPDGDMETYFDGFADVYEAKVYIDPARSLEDFYEVVITPSAFAYYCNGDED